MNYGFNRQNKEKYTYNPALVGWEELALPSNVAYAKFNSTTNVLTFFQDFEGKYTNGEVIGDDTYYTGVENTGRQTPPWYSKNHLISDIQFEAVISPLSCYRWFANVPAPIIDLGDPAGAAQGWLDTSSTTDMQSMFEGAHAVSIICRSNIDTSSVTTMTRMFASCAALESILVDPTAWSTASVSNDTNMFYGCINLVGDEGTVWSNVSWGNDSTLASVDGGADSPGYLISVYGPLASRQIYVKYNRDEYTLTFFAGEQGQYENMEMIDYDVYFIVDESDSTYYAPQWIQYIANMGETPYISGIRINNRLDSISYNGWFLELGAIDALQIHGMHRLSPYGQYIHDQSKLRGPEHAYTMFHGVQVPAIDLSWMDVEWLVYASNMFYGCAVFRIFSGKHPTPSLSYLNDSTDMFTDCNDLIGYDAGAPNDATMFKSIDERGYITPAYLLGYYYVPESQSGETQISVELDYYNAFNLDSLTVELNGTPLVYQSDANWTVSERASPQSGIHITIRSSDPDIVFYHGDVILVYNNTSI